MHNPQDVREKTEPANKKDPFFTVQRLKRERNNRADITKKQ